MDHTKQPTLATLVGTPQVAVALAAHLGGAAPLASLVAPVSRSTHAALAGDAVWGALLDAAYPVNPHRVVRVLGASLDLPESALAAGSAATVFAHYHDLYRRVAAAAADAEEEAAAGPSSSTLLAERMGRMDLAAHAGHIPEIDPETHAVAKTAFEHMAAFEAAGGDPAHLQSAVAAGARALAVYPFHPGVAHLLAFAASVVGQLPLARELAEHGLALDPEFDDLVELHAKITAVLRDTPADSPLLASFTPPTLRPRLERALRSAFTARDADKDGLWAPRELQAFIAHMNGARPPVEFCFQFVRMFGGRDDGKLTADGLVDFFAQQAANEPDETVKDFAKLGIKV
ncbi:hypothetical protein H9P43_008466 [Blastocladiella emersonii ATCC 22665]|nr:hypothetical protein H9P43_008466 [Blastocladiella emersonii ATCC 22665]